MTLAFSIWKVVFHGFVVFKASPWRLRGTSRASRSGLGHFRPRLQGFWCQRLTMSCRLPRSSSHGGYGVVSANWFSESHHASFQDACSEPKNLHRHAQAAWP